jgi:hypothetical protein
MINVVRNNRQGTSVCVVNGQIFDIRKLHLVAICEGSRKVRKSEMELYRNVSDGLWSHSVAVDARFVNLSRPAIVAV